MKTLSFACAAVLVLSIASSRAAAQKRPDFTGTWQEDASQRRSPYDKPSQTTGAKSLAAPPSDIVITQTADTITIARTFMDVVTRMTYDLNGKENVNRTGAQTHTTRTRWDGNRIVTEGSVYQITSAGEESWTLKDVRWINAKGEMVLEHTQVDEDGKAVTVHRVFRRK